MSTQARGHPTCSHLLALLDYHLQYTAHMVDFGNFAHCAIEYLYTLCTVHKMHCAHALHFKYLYTLCTWVLVHCQCHWAVHFNTVGCALCIVLCTLCITNTIQCVTLMVRRLLVYNKHYTVYSVNGTQVTCV